MVTQTIRLREEDIKYLEDSKLSRSEPLYSVMSRLVDKVKALDKRVKQ